MMQKPREQNGIICWVNLERFMNGNDTTPNRTTGDETFGGDTHVPAESRYATKRVLSWRATSLTVSMIFQRLLSAGTCPRQK